MAGDGKCTVLLALVISVAFDAVSRIVKEVTVHLGNSPKFMTTAKTRQALVRKIGEECKVVMKHENKRITQITGQEHNVYDALRRLTGIDAAAVRPAAQSDEKTSQVNPIDGAEAHSADAKQSANKEGTDERLHSQATDIEDHMWNYIQHKHPEIVAKFAEKFHVELELQSLYDKDGKKYSNLQMSSDDQAKLDEAFEDLANIVQDKFGKVSGFVIEMKKDDADCVKDLVRNEGFIVMPQSFYHITGPNHSLHQVRTKVVQALIDKYGLKKTAESAGPVDSVDDRPASAAQLKIDEKKHDGVDPVDPVVEKPLKPSASEDKEHGVVFSFRSLSGIDVRICRGNIIHQKVEAIVNAANVHLDHSSGIAKCIKDAAGQKFNDECKQLVKKHGGRLKTAEPVYTSAGKIPPPVKYVIHVAGPEARNFGDKNVLRDAVKRTFENVLMYANDELKVSSVAIPAISSGIYGVPKQMVAECTYEALANFDLVHLPSATKHLHTVNFVNIDEETTGIIERVFRLYSTGTASVVPQQPTASVYKADDSGRRDKNVTYAQAVGAVAGPNHGQSRDNYERRHQAAGNVDNKHTEANAAADAVAAANGAYAESDKVIHPSNVQQAGAPARQRRLKQDDCTICMEPTVRPKKLGCGHSFCTDCIDQYFQMGQPKCPNCGKLFGVLKGNQPHGTFNWKLEPFSLAGYPHCKTIEITYDIPDGTQTDEHPNPGVRYKGARRTGYLPDTPEGQEVRTLLKRAFDARLIFTVGRSVTSGQDNVVVWNDIHHKTKPTGPHGYPDDTYLKRVKEELAAKGIVP